VTTIETPAGRVVFIRSPRLLTPEQIVLALASMAEDDPRWLAVHQLLDQELATAALNASNPALGDSQVRHAGGAMDALATLKQRLFDERRKPMNAVKAERPAARARRAV